MYCSLSVYLARPASPKKQGELHKTDSENNCPCCDSLVGEDAPHPWCESCQRWYHLWCLKTTAEQLPKGDFHCPTCLNKQEQENQCIVLQKRCKSLEEEVISLKENESRWREKAERLESELNILKRKEVPGPVTSHSQDLNIEDVLKQIMSRLEVVELNHVKLNGQVKIAVDKAEQAVNVQMDQEARACGRDVVNGGVGKGNHGVSINKGGQTQTMVAVEGSVGESNNREGDKWRVVRRKKGKGRGGQKGRAVSFQVVADSHGRELGRFLKGAEVDVKGGAKMEAVVEGVGNGGKKCTVIMGETNDTTEEGVRRGLSKLRGKMGNSKNVIVVGVPKRYDDPYPHVFDMIKRKNEMIKTFCGIHGYIFLNIDDTKRSYFTKHGLHLNLHGKRWLAEKIQSTVSFLW